MNDKKTISMAALLLASLSAAHAQFSAGDLVVLQDGTGAAALTSAGTAIFLDQYTTGGTYVNDVSIPSTGASALVDSGTAGSEGQISLSGDGQYIVVAGYNANAGTASIASTTATAAPRALATVNASGNYVLATSSTTAFSANNIRSGTTDGSGNLWAVGANTGVAYLGTGTAATVSTTSANNRLIQNIGGNLYFSTGSGSTRGIYEISGLPTTAGSTAVSVINTSSLGSASPYGFAFNSSMTECYIADSDAYTTAAGMGGIEKWTLVSGTWTFQYSLPTDGVGADGVAVDFSGVDPTIYATSADGADLFKDVDSGATTTTPVSLATAGIDEAFRGLTFAPQAVPEPGILALLGVGVPSILWQMRRNRKA